jgi:DNA-binding GntR family transcriptional regulator
VPAPSQADLPLPDAPTARLEDQPIVRPSLHDEVTARLRDLIVEGRLPAGERIPELDVARSLGISRTPLREALKVLASEGLVELQAGRGAVVKVVTPRDAQDMLALTGLLEAHAGRLAALEATDAEIAAIVALHRRMREHYARRERPEYFALNQQVHDAIVRAAHSSTLSMLHGQLRMRMRRIRYIGNHSPQNWAAAMAEHDGFVDALAARDGERLAALLQAHMANTWPRVSSSVAEPGDGV